MQNSFAGMRVAIAGTGWRAEFYARICQALPESFRLCGIMYHSEKGRASAEKWNVPLVSTLSELIDRKPDFIVLSLAGQAMFDALEYLYARDVPCLCETFTARDEAQLNEMYGRLKRARVQFAEQYQFQPLNAARLALARGGMLGEVYYTRMSIPTRHHPASLVRMVLGAGHRRASIEARAFCHKALRGPGRAGDPAGESEFDASHALVLYDFGDKQAVNDFEDMQHRSFMRANDFLIRGPRGEIINERATYMIDALTPCEIELKRVMAGAGVDLQGLFLRGVSGGQAGWLYQNPFMPARLYDDELAVASCMRGMAEYLQSGRGFYGLADVFTDMYFALLTNRAIESGARVKTETQSWMD